MRSRASGITVVTECPAAQLVTATSTKERCDDRGDEREELARKIDDDLMFFASFTSDWCFGTFSFFFYFSIYRE